MTDVLTLVFKAFVAQSGAGAVHPQTSAPDPYRSVLVVGDRAVSRNVLLLSAVTAASESGLRVIFFTQTQIQNLPVSLQRRVPNLNPDTLKKIKFSYPRNLPELLVQVAGLHEAPHSSPAPPALIIVDGLEGYLCSSSQSTSAGSNASALSSAAHLSSLLCDTASFLSQVLDGQGGPAPCRLVASYQPRDAAEQKSGDSSTDSVLDVLGRYLPVRCTLDQDKSYEATSGGFSEVWNIYFSCLGSTRSLGKNEAAEKQTSSTFEEWRLLLSPDGLMEFMKVQNTK